MHFIEVGVRMFTMCQKKKEEIRIIRGLGEKGIREIIRALQSYGITYTEWELI